MRHIKWTDRVKGPLNSVKETLNFNRESAIHVALAVVVAIGISAAMIHGIAPSKSIYNADMERMEAGITHIGSNLANLSMDTDTILALWPLATEAQLNTVSNKVTGHTGDLNTLDDRITTVEADVAGIMASPPEGYLTGTFGNYILHAKCSEAGNFTATVHLVYSPPLWLDDGNSTVEEVLGGFSPAMNWVTPTVAYNGTMWTITGVAFNIGIFAMVSNNETLVGITFGRLSSTYEPDFAYVEVWPVLK